MTTLTDFAKAKHLVNSHSGYLLEAAIADAVAAERERCAKIADRMADNAAVNSPWHGHQIILREVAKRIRSDTSNG